MEFMAPLGLDAVPKCVNERISDRAQAAHSPRCCPAKRAPSETSLLLLQASEEETEGYSMQGQFCKA